MTLIRLGAGAWAAELVPDDGAGMTMLRHAGHDVLVPAPDGQRLGGPFGAFWMIPWANRLDGGRLGSHRLPINRSQEDTAIHGLSRDRAWRATSAAPHRAVLEQAVDAAPYRYDAQLEVSLAPDGVMLDLTITNRGEAEMPFGAGWHPWFSRPAGTRLRFHATDRCSHDTRGLPVAAAASKGLDGGDDVLPGLDTHFPGWDGTAVIGWPGISLTMTASGALASNLQVYAPHDKAVLCVEPSSHLPDVANRAGMAALGPMRQLAPGESMNGRIVLTAESSHPR